MKRTKYDGNVGRFLTAADAKARTKLFRRTARTTQLCLEKEGIQTGEVIRAEFFGINRINKLLGRTECVGIRIYYGNRWEDENGDPTSDGKGELKNRLVLVGVRSDGSDIFEDGEGLKGGGDGDALGDGLPCPQNCASNHKV
ncbi:hypothetical protein [Tellurirhabdus bombi]|uniref:hypothetical protein n=1 Tax=Tellurirhabdus bombi TaxID=2907205 RepID=UPI001F3800A4|nr:hypothetical protein [Tellurirhabdus bombi]